MTYTFGGTKYCSPPRPVMTTVNQTFFGGSHSLGADTPQGRSSIGTCPPAQSVGEYVWALVTTLFCLSRFR